MGEAPTPKGSRRRQELVEAAADILATAGPSGVTMRAVARSVGCALSATGYYFEDRDQMLREAGRFNIAKWAGSAEHVAEEAEAAQGQRTPAEVVELLLRAVLSRDTPLFGHYLQLLAAGESAPVSRAYFTGRGRLNNAVTRVLACTGVQMSADLVIAVIDGAAVTALSEGRDVMQTARRVLTELLDVQSRADS